MMAKTKTILKRKVLGRKLATADSSQFTANKRASFQEYIDALKARKTALEREYLNALRLKLSDAKKVVSTLEAELEQLTGKPSGAPKIRRERRPSITDDALKDQLLKVMAADGKMGMNARQLSEKVGQDAIRVRKFIATNPKLLKKTGAGAGTKFFLP